MKQDNSILFKDLGPLNPPAHIKTRFDVKVGGVLSQMALLFFGPKKYIFFAPLTLL